MRHTAPWSVVPLPSGDADPGLSLTQDGALIRRTILPGGIRVLTEDIPSTRSVALGAWVAVGSRDEADEHAGATHFLEHLLFKGTATRMPTTSPPRSAPSVGSNAAARTRLLLGAGPRRRPAHGGRVIMDMVTPHCWTRTSSRPSGG